MEKIGDGENVVNTAKPTQADHLTSSQTNGKKPTKPTKPPTTPVEAAAFLASALSYCLDAGLIVEVFSEEPSLMLSIDGLEYADDTIRVKKVTPAVEVTPEVTPAEVVVSQ